MSSVKIIIVDDHDIFREGLAALLEKEPGISVAGQAKNGKEAIELAKNLNPDIIIMDVSMPEMGGIEASRTILQVNPDIKIIILSMYANKYFIVSAFDAGISGYVHKENCFEELSHAVSAVCDGKKYLSPSITDVFLKSLYDKPDKSQIGSAEHATLNDRDIQIVRYLVDGLTVKQIAMKTHLSPKTIDSNRRAIMEKLGMTSIADLVKWAIVNGYCTSQSQPDSI